MKGYLWLALLAGCATSSAVIHNDMPPSSGEERVISGTGLRYIEIAPGEGDVAERHKCVYTHYTLYRRNGQWLQSSRDTVNGKAGEPASFELGTGRVIKGWDIGVEGMRIGEVRRLFVPEEMGYGANGSPPLIPGHAFLVFDIQLMAIAPLEKGQCPSWASIQG